MIRWADNSAKCGTFHEWTPLSLFSAGISILLIITTAPLSFLIMLVLLRKRNSCFSSVFYKLLFNIALSDFLTAIVGDTGSLNFLIKEAYGLRVPASEVYWVHVPLFFNGGASILTLSLLSIDRVVALLRPLKYRDGVKDWKVLAALISTWILSGLLVIWYFKIGFIKFLALYVFTTVFFSSICLTVAAIVYHAKFRSSGAVAPTVSRVVQKHTDKSCKDNQVRLRIERRVNTSFVITLALFLITYLPSCCMTVYMNTCTHCDCLLIHVLRDLTFLLIYFSALLRSINFISRLLTIKRAIKEILGFTEPTDSERSASGQRGQGDSRRVSFNPRRVDTSATLTEPDTDLI